MEKIRILIIFFSILSVAVIILVTILIFLNFSISQKISGMAVINSYSYTKGICNETNYCEDYEINCSGNRVVSMKFTGAAIQNSFNWKDPRDNETIGKLC